MMPASVWAELVPMAGAQGRVLYAAAIDGSEIAVTAIVFGTVSSVVYPLIKAWARRIENRGRPAALPDHDTQERLERIERAVEAIALEVERVSEGQRFVTKVMAERGANQLPPKSE